MANEVSKKEFLKRYLEKEEESSRKRKKQPKLTKPKTNIPCLKIVNEDIDLKSMNFGEKADDDDVDEAPVIAEVIDERPLEEKLKELYDSSRWKKIDSSDLCDVQRAASHERHIKNRRHDSDEDLSPLREQKKPGNVNISSSQNHKQNKKRHDSDSDTSQPKGPLHSRNKQKSDSDISPPRTQKQSRNKHNSDSDLSPMRSRKENRNKENSDSDLSPPRNQKQSKSKHNFGSNSSPQQNRSRNNSDSDLSPPRSHKASSTKEKNKLDKTLSGLKAGLQNSKSLKEEVQEFRNREKYQLNMLGDEISGRNADTIIRDRRTGKKRDLNKEQETKNEEDKKNKEYLQKYEKWGKGTETRDEHLEKLKDEIHEMSKPLARYEDDADLDERLRMIIHDEDPMSAYMKKKKHKEGGTSNYPVYTGPSAPPNRFGIKPGYRWDGVDRSNGFEAKYFEKINHTKAVKDEAYLWSVQDM